MFACWLYLDNAFGLYWRFLKVDTAMLFSTTSPCLIWHVREERSTCFLLLWRVCMVSEESLLRSLYSWLSGLSTSCLGSYLDSLGGLSCWWHSFCYHGGYFVNSMCTWVLPPVKVFTNLILSVSIEREQNKKYEIKNNHWCLCITAKDIWHGFDVTYSRIVIENSK